MNNELNELNSCITDVRECINNSCLNISCDDIVMRIHEPIDTDKFKSWFDYNLDKFKNKSNQASYFKKAFENELNKGTFTLNKVIYVPNTEPIMNELRGKGIVLLADDTGYLYVLWWELRNRYKIPNEILMQINRDAVIQFNIKSDFKHYIRLIQTSPYLKDYKIDWEDIKRQADKFNRNWDKKLDEMESSYE